MTNAERPDPNVSGPCQVQSSFLCAQVGTLRLNPTDMLDTATSFQGYVTMCQPCFDRQSDLFIEARHT